MYSAFYDRFEDVASFVPPSAHSILLIAAAAEALPAQVISRVARSLLASGLIYVCVWGSDCERVHDIFDEVCVGDGDTTQGASFMSTWHNRDSLEEAIWFFIVNAFPLDDALDDASFVAITIGNPSWAEVVEQALAEPDAFITSQLD